MIDSQHVSREYKRGAVENIELPLLLTRLSRAERRQHAEKWVDEVIHLDKGLLLETRPGGASRELAVSR